MEVRKWAPSFNDEMNEAFQRLWDENPRPSYSVIANEMNKQFGELRLTRNSISGIVSRAGMQSKFIRRVKKPRPPKVRRADAVERQFARRILTEREIADKRAAHARIRSGKKGSRMTGGAWLSGPECDDKPLPTNDDNFEALNLTLAQLEDDQCHWIMEDTGLYCGQKGKPYCPYHAMRRRQR